MRLFDRYVICRVKSELNRKLTNIYEYTHTPYRYPVHILHTFWCAYFMVTWLQKGLLTQTKSARMGEREIEFNVAPKHCCAIVSMLAALCLIFECLIFEGVRQAKSCVCVCWFYSGTSLSLGLNPTPTIPLYYWYRMLQGNSLTLQFTSLNDQQDNTKIGSHELHRSSAEI